MIVTGLFVYWSILAKYSLYLMREKLYQFFHEELIITVVSTQVFDELIQVVLSGSVTLSFRHTVTFKVNVICLTFWHYGKCLQNLVSTVYCLKILYLTCLVLSDLWSPPVHVELLWFSAVSAVNLVVVGVHRLRRPTYNSTLLKLTWRFYDIKFTTKANLLSIKWSWG